MRIWTLVKIRAMRMLQTLISSVCFFRTEAHRPMFHSHLPRDMWRCRAEVRIQLRHQEVPSVFLQRLWGEWEQLRVPQKLHRPVHQRPKGYDCMIGIANVHFTHFLWKKVNVHMLLCSGAAHRKKIIRIRKKNIDYIVNRSTWKP